MFYKSLGINIGWFYEGKVWFCCKGFLVTMFLKNDGGPLLPWLVLEFAELFCNEPFNLLSDAPLLRSL